jgi:hypothetical protein
MIEVLVKPIFWKKFGRIAKAVTGLRLPLMVLQSESGYYIGTADDEGPVSRESVEYWPSASSAENALASGQWLQRYEL